MNIVSIDLIGYDGSRYPIEIDTDDVSVMTIEIHSGDEVLNVIDSEGTRRKFDPMSDDRAIDYYQGSYFIYDDGRYDVDGVIYDVTSDSNWVNRRHPEDWLMSKFGAVARPESR